MARPVAPCSLANTCGLNNRINRKLLEVLSAEQFTYPLAPKSTTIGEQLAHLHNVRMMWLKVIRGKNAGVLPRSFERRKRPGPRLHDTVWNTHPGSS
jgi:hypothetical protein